jgi:hypothetical protein
LGKIKPRLKVIIKKLVNLLRQASYQYARLSSINHVAACLSQDVGHLKVMCPHAYSREPRYKRLRKLVKGVLEKVIYFVTQSSKV